LSNLTKPPGRQGNLDEFSRETRPSSILGSKRFSI
jgi:hypothetical protein